MGHHTVELQVPHLSHPSCRAIDHSHRQAGRTAKVAAVLLFGLIESPAIANAAGVGARATGYSSVATGTWGATASVTSMSFTTNTFQTLTVTNTGSVALTARSYSVTISKPTGRAPTFKVFRCAVAWVATTCSGGTGTEIGGTLPANSTTIITSTAPLAPGAAFYLQVEPSGVRSLTTVTISPRVTAPSQLRAPIESNQ